MIKILNAPLSFIIALAFLLIIGWNTVFIVEQTQQAIVLQFGRLSHVYTEPGLKFRIPFIQEVVYYEKRILDLDSTAPVRVTTGDQKRVWVDYYARYRIKSPLLFYRTVKPANEVGARSRLEVLIPSAIRNVLGRLPLRALLSEERSHIMQQINHEVSVLAKELGVTIIDVRIIRAELPQENRSAVFARMKAELQRIAKQNRANGAEKSQTIRAEADKEKVLILAEARKEAQILRGEGDGKAAAIAAKILGRDANFYNFYRALQVYQRALGDKTTLVLTTNNDVLRYFTQEPNNNSKKE